jgi:hypothetical protein
MKSIHMNQPGALVDFSTDGKNVIAEEVTKATNSQPAGKRNASHVVKSVSDNNKPEYNAYTNPQIYSQQILFSGIDPQQFIEAICQAVVNKLKKHRESELLEKMLSTDEACKLFQPIISRQTLSSWTKLQLIPMQKIGGQNFYKYSDIINAGKVLKRYKR